MINKTPKSISAAWSRYWSTASPKSSGCLPDAPKAVGDCIQDIWSSFFSTLPENARLLDLGTGGAAVLKLALASRPDLQLTGVDYAETLPDLGKEATMLAKTKLEQLPFHDESFEVITSQFALEYAHLPKTLAEIKRVLLPTGSFLFLCHHAEGIIVKHNVSRQTAIKDLLAGSGLLNSAIKIVQGKKNHDPKKLKHLAKLLQALQLKHPDQSIINEVAEMTANMTQEAGGLRNLLALRQDIEMEGRRISALAAAALDHGQVEDIVRHIASPKREVAFELILVPETSTPLAWKISTVSS